MPGTKSSSRLRRTAIPAHRQFQTGNDPRRNCCCVFSCHFFSWVWRVCKCLRLLRRIEKPPDSIFVVAQKSLVFQKQTITTIGRYFAGLFAQCPCCVWSQCLHAFRFSLSNFRHWSPYSRTTSAPQPPHEIRTRLYCRAAFSAFSRLKRRPRPYGRQYFGSPTHSKRIYPQAAFF